MADKKNLIFSLISQILNVWSEATVILVFLSGLITLGYFFSTSILTYIEDFQFPQDILLYLLVIFGAIIFLLLYFSVVTLLIVPYYLVGWILVLLFVFPGIPIIIRIIGLILGISDFVFLFNTFYLDNSSDNIKGKKIFQSFINHIFTRSEDVELENKISDPDWISKLSQDQ